tara:strand:+ start:365 stop:790 length:426 start_codon:yes stop_codon:yes gene_type:complete
METGHVNPTNYSTNQLDSQTSSALTASVPWVWICAIPFVLGGILALVLAGLALLASFKAGGAALLLGGLQLIQAIIVLYLGVSLIKFAVNVSKYKGGEPSALLTAFTSLSGYFRVMGLLIVLTIALVIGIIVLGVGAASFM